MPAKSHKSASKAGSKTSASKNVKSGLINPPSKITTYTVPPAGWPAKMPYLAISTISPNLTPPQQAMLQRVDIPLVATNTQLQQAIYKVDSLATFSPVSNPLVQIRSITDQSHPAFPQCGLFAAKRLPAGSHIVDYTGMVHSCPEPTCATSDYDLAFLDRDASLAIDSAAMGNESRFVNDYHGIRNDGPNAVFEEYYVKIKNPKSGKDVWQARMGIWVAPATAKNDGGSRGKANRASDDGIDKGEEICVSYGKGWWRARRALMDGSTEEEEGGAGEAGEKDTTALQLASDGSVAAEIQAKGIAQ